MSDKDKKDEKEPEPKEDRDIFREDTFEEIHKSVKPEDKDK